MRKAFCLLTIAALVALCGSNSFAGDKIFDLTSLQDSGSAPSAGKTVTVKLSGKINHFGNPNYHAIVPGVHVWIAEYPFSKNAGVVSDESGWWSFSLKKLAGAELPISLMYEKSEWPTTKSNVILIGDGDEADIAIQFIDKDYYYNEMKPKVESMLKLVAPKSGGKMKNAMVATVGKKWASMHDDRLPHGDPGATVTKIPDAIGPIYFNEKVQPDPLYGKTSVDGGVAWLNVPPGEHVVTASREGVEYAEVKFIVEEANIANGVELYIASPPDSIIGTNVSGPGDKRVTTEEKENSTKKPSPKEAIEIQAQLIKDGDAASLRDHFTERLRDGITDDAVRAAQSEISAYGIDDLVAKVDISEDGLSAKIHMANGRTLTTLLWNGERWLADTVWFR